MDLIIYKFNKNNNNYSKFVGKVYVALNLFALSHFEEMFYENTNITLFWCDGIFGLWHLKNRKLKPKKVPGAEFTRKFLKNKNKEIIVIGNMDNNEYKFLNKNGFKILSHYKLENFSESQLSDVFICKECDILITLPSPIQEKVAYILFEKYNLNNFYCVGGGLNMATYKEREAPEWIRILNLETLFRLKTDPVRRISRLIICLFKFFKNYKKIFKYNWVEYFE